MIAGLLVFAVKLLSGASVRWSGSLPAPRQRIYFANHTSHLDAVLIWAALPRELRQRTRLVAARDYWTSGRLRPYLAQDVFNAVLIERQHFTPHDNPVDQLLEALGQDHSLIIFPEGGRGHGDDLRPFKSGLFHMARRRPDLELIPVLVDNLNRILPKGEVLPVPLLGSVTFGPPLSPIDGEIKHDFLERARAAVINLRPA